MIDVHDELVAALAHRYDIERELGHGGMAVVYLARDARHDRRVAVKVLRPELATSLGSERFLREIRIAARLTHPNILALHDSGEAGGMLYFVMPYVEGETLRDRMEREHQLPLEEAIAIARQVGLALDYAHERGVVHRDIKPENILLVGDHVLVADFGLARALYSAGTQRLTESAVAVGTPAYMSPEQAAADPDVDGRTDLYSLACVLFEMIAGLPPFKGATAAALLAQHLTAVPPSICAQRPHCPKSVDAAVARALEKTPADRFRTAKEFLTAMTAQPAVSSSGDAPGVPRTAIRTPATRTFVVGGVALVAVVAAITAALWRPPAHRARGNGTGAGTEGNSFVVLPLTANDSAARRDTAMIAQRVSDALGEWGGVRVAGTRETSDLLSRFARGDRVRLDDAFEIARKLGAAKLVWGEISAAGTERRARLAVYDVSTGAELRPAVLAYGGDGPDLAQLRLTANNLLRTRQELPWSGRGAAPERPSLSAWKAYDAGREAVGRWDVADATRQFSAAMAIDPSHAQANLWWSLMQMWSGSVPDRWRSAARRAYEARDRLGAGDSALATAQLALSEGRYPDACAAYRRVLTTDSSGVIGWYGLGECQSRDSLVVRDRASPSSWRFRGSLNQAINAYMRIIDDGVPPQPAFVYSRLSQLLVTSGNVLRPGHSEYPNRVEFGAYQTLSADTLATIPYPLADSAGNGGPPVPAAKARALDHNRSLLRRLYRSWAAGTPTVEAYDALARLLESLDEIGGDGSALSALGQIRRARALSTDPGEQLLLARTELRLLVKTGDWTRVANFADSLFGANTNIASDTAGALGGAAALSGRIGALAQILRGRGGAPSFTLTMPNGRPLDVPPTLKVDAAATFAYAVSGACVDTLRGYQARIDRQLPSYFPDARQRTIARGVLLRRPLAIAMPCVGPAALLGIEPAGDRMVQLEQAFAAHDVPAFRAIYGSLMSFRSVDRPGENALDYTFVESWMLRALGDSAEAAKHLDQSLEALPTLGKFILDFPAHSAALVRAMGLRAELAAAAGDKATAARWGRAVATLWAHADPELQPYVKQMCALAQGCIGAPDHGVER